MKNTVIALLALLASAGSLAATPWQKISQPIGGSAQSIGAFSNGCIVGAEALPLVLVDGDVALAGRYPNRAELSRWAGLGAAAPSPAAGSCCAAGRCC